MNRLKDIFKRSSVKKVLLATVSSIGIMANANAWDNNGYRHDDTINFPNDYIIQEQIRDICSPSKGISSRNDHFGHEKQLNFETAVSVLSASPLAHSYLSDQNNTVCVSPYDVPANGFFDGAQKGDLVFLLADELVNNDLIRRGFHEVQSYNSVSNRMRTAVRMSLTAQILTELHMGGESDGIAAAIDTKYGHVFKQFVQSRPSEINDGTAHIRAIKNYMHSSGNIYSRGRYSDRGRGYPQRNLRNYRHQDYYKMGERPNMPNIFESTFYNKRNFNLQNLMPSRDPYNNRGRGHR